MGMGWGRRRSGRVTLAVGLAEITALYGTRLNFAFGDWS